jgi:uncharacterized membrane protein
MEIFDILRASLTPVAFVLLCMAANVLLHAWYNLARKAELNKQTIWMNRTAAFTTFANGGASVLLFAITAMTGGPQVSTNALHWNNGFWGPALLCGMLQIGAQFSINRANSLEDVSLVTPIHSTTPALVILTSMLLLGEFPTALGWIGIWVLAIGTYALQLQDAVGVVLKRRAKERSDGWPEGVRPRDWTFWVSVWLAPIIALKDSRGVRWAFFAVFLSVFSLNYDGLIARNANVAFGSACAFGISALGNCVLALAKGEFRGLPVGYSLVRTSLYLGLLFGIMHIPLNWAYREAIVPYIASLKRFAIPLTIIGAYVILGERKSFTGRFIGGALMTIGAILITLGMEE